jgi:hypothetical protein
MQPCLRWRGRGVFLAYAAANGQRSDSISWRLVNVTQLFVDARGVPESGLRSSPEGGDEQVTPMSPEAIAKARQEELCREAEQ